MEWRPIETAPKGGVQILLAAKSSCFPFEWIIRVGWWDTDEWVHMGPDPTHWMPLPPNPTDPE